MKEVEFVVFLDTHVRLRHSHQTEQGDVVGFALQLEAETGDAWKPVVRYDSAHGEAHRHVFRERRYERREALNLGFADALTFAEADLRANWERYLKEFLE